MMARTHRPYCRNCPRCGSNKSRRVGYNFRPGSWKQCLKCGQEYKPPISLLVGIFSLLFGSGVLTFLVMLLRSKPDRQVMALVGAIGLLFLLFGVWVVVRNATSPKGPLSGFPLDQ